ncbi:hypothetical protein [Mycoplasma feriruminatoris]|nr:hypothetical protein [Mycoplasma feriruminatoris]
MGSSNWVEEWNRILNIVLFSTTPIKIWDKYINKAGLNLYGITEHNSIFYYFINLTKIGFGSLCLTLLTIFCKKTIFNPFRNVYRYLKHRNLYVTSKMDETISFLNKLRDRVEKKMSKKYCILLKLLKKLHINQFI